MKRLSFFATMLVLSVILPAGNANAFCGFYVGKADTKLFNQASQVVISRDGDKTVVTMSNDFKGDPKEFAMVIPVPTVLEKGSSLGHRHLSPSRFFEGGGYPRQLLVCRTQ